jgi:hypothetical protein
MAATQIPPKTAPAPSRHAEPRPQEGDLSPPRPAATTDNTPRNVLPSPLTFIGRRMQGALEGRQTAVSAYADRRGERSALGHASRPNVPVRTSAKSPTRSQVDRSLKAIVRAAAIAAIRRRRGWRLLSVERMLAAVDRTRARRARKRARRAPGHRASAPRWRHAPGSRWDTPARRTKASAAVSEAGLLLAVQPERPPLHVAGSARQVCLDPDLRAPSVISAPAGRDRHREAADRSALSSSIGSTPRTVASPTFASTRGRKAFSQHSTGHREGGMPELIACRLQE